jgi:hypothetical protein
MPEITDFNLDQRNGGWTAEYSDGTVKTGNLTSVAGDGNPVGVLLIGQSNCVGWDANAFDARLDYVPTGVMQYSPDGTGTAAYARQVVPASNPLLWPNSQSASFGVSSAGHFAAWANVLGSEAGRLVLIPAAVGGTALVGSRWAYPAGDLCAQAVSTARQFLADVPGSRIGYIVIVQGEADASAGVSGPAYQAAFDGLINGLRSIAGMQDAVVIVGGMVPEWVAERAAAVVIAAVHAEAPLRLPRCIYVPGPTGANNSVHYTAAGYRIAGRRWARKALTRSHLLDAPAAPAVTVAGRTLSVVIPATDCAAVEVDYRPIGGDWTTVRLPITYWEPGTVLSHAVPGELAAEARARAINHVGSTVSETLQVDAVTGDTASGLLARLNFEDSANLGANDVGATFAVSSVTQATDAVRGKVAVFGGGATRTAVHLSTLDLPQPAYTKAAWILWDGTQAASGYTNILSGDASVDTGDHVFGIHGGMVKASDGGLSSLFSSGITPAAGVWEHWAVTRDAEGLQILYRNGTEVARRTGSPTTTAGAGTSIGSFNSGANNNWQGRLDDVRLYNRALAPNDILVLAST